MKRINLYVAEQQLSALVRLARASGLSLSEHIRRAIDLYLGVRNSSEGDDGR